MSKCQARKSADAEVPKQIDVFDMWANYVDARVYYGKTFDPTGKVERGVLNTFPGFEAMNSIFSDLGRHLENVPKIQLEEQFHSYERLVLPFDQPHKVIAIKEMIHLALDEPTIPIIWLVGPLIIRRIV